MYVSKEASQVWAGIVPASDSDKSNGHSNAAPASSRRFCHESIFWHTISAQFRPQGVKPVLWDALTTTSLWLTDSGRKMTPRPFFYHAENVNLVFDRLAGTGYRRGQVTPGVVMSHKEVGRQDSIPGLILRHVLVLETRQRENPNFLFSGSCRCRLLLVCYKIKKHHYYTSTLHRLFSARMYV